MSNPKEDQAYEDRVRLLEQKKKMAEAEAVSVQAMKAKAEEERAREQETRAYAEPFLEAQVQRTPRHPLTPAQIDRAVVMAEIARRRIAAARNLSPAQALEQASAQPRARLRQDHLESTLDHPAPSRPAPRM